MEECIYNLIPRPAEVVRKPDRYVSKYDPNAPVHHTTFGIEGTTQVHGNATAKESIRRGHGQHSSIGKSRTFGKIKGQNDPKNYMKARTGTKELPKKDTQGFRYPDHETRRPRVPVRGERPVMGLQSTKNFITANAVEAILAVPGNRARQEVEPPVYRKKVDYGKVPAYLSQVKDEIERENEMIEDYVKSQNNMMSEDVVQEEELVEDERQALLNALKIKWDSVNANYQKICHMVKLDTIGKVRRKEKMEAELEQLEQDIGRLEGRHVVIRSN